MQPPDDSSEQSFEEFGEQKVNQSCQFSVGQCFTFRFWSVDILRMVSQYLLGHSVCKFRVPIVSNSGRLTDFNFVFYELSIELN